MKIVFLDSATVGAIDNLEELNSFGEYISYDETPDELRAERIAGAEIILTNKVVIDRELISGAKSLKLICVTATGLNNIDLEAAKECGIELKNVAGYSTESVVQTTFALILTLVSKINQYNDYVHSGEYEKSISFTKLTPAFYELSGKTLGIIGLGTIGRRVAQVAQAFGMNVVYYSTSGKNNNSDYKQLRLDDLLASSDIVTIHSPLNYQTLGLINAECFKKMKPSAYIINTGRGGIIVEQDLCDALNENIISGAAVDVFSAEPILSSNPLRRVKNKTKLIMTPHIAWASLESRKRLVNSVIKNIKDFLI